MSGDADEPPAGDAAVTPRPLERTAEVVADVPTLRRRMTVLRARAGGPIGFVPTMGALHEGHRSLVRRAADRCGVVVASVYVNPLQFGDGEDFQTYPRDLERDVEHLADEGVALVFAPSTGSFVPPDRATTVHVAGVSEPLEGQHRPGHFDGVATIVTKLLSVVGPDRAYFGEKDYQQLLVVRRLVADLDLPVAVEGCPTVREGDGLAVSSRNAFLSPAQRERAAALPRALFSARAAWDGDADRARRLLRTALDDASGVEVDYAEVCDPETLDRLEGRGYAHARALAAVRVGGTRLIDNVALASGGDESDVDSPVARP